MTRRVNSDLLLVGSLPADSTEAAFRSAGQFFGDLVFALPDGETGPRAGWVSYERERLVRPNEGIVTLQETESPTGLPRHAYETQDLERVLAWTSEGAWERFAGPVTRLTRLIPSEALVGYHLCYGTFPEWPMYEARDMDLLVRMANFAVANSGRTVDWLHLAGPRYLRSEDRSFFRPLVDLEPLDARVFLGIVLPLDGAAGLRRRVDTASRYISDFGVAMYCGFGRQPGQDGTETMREHADVVRTVRTAG